jgi:N-methylhydantoinase B/oxoprolinase/acetone carboxylase alpha subunit
VNVQYPGPVSLNTTSGGSMVRYLANSLLMQALAHGDRWDKEVMAISAGHRNLRHAGVNQYGRYAVSALGHGALDGTGARSYQDGVNSWGGHLSCANVEWFEMNFPVLYLFPPPCPRRDGSRQISRRRRRGDRAHRPWRAGRQS